MSTQRTHFILLGLVLSLAAGRPAEAATLHVAPSGNDAWSGRLAEANADKTDGPLATLAGAREAIRKLKTPAALAEPVRVVVAQGVYTLTEPLVLTPDDSGSPTCPISYEAAPGAKPCFTGGRRIGGFTKAENGMWTARVPEVAAGQWYFEQLWVNGRRAVRARSPNKFYYYVLAKVNRGTDPGTGQAADLTNRAFRARPEDIAALRAVAPKQFSDVTLVTYHSWETSRSRLAGVDLASGTVVATAGVPWGFAYWGANCRYHLENFRAALDEPGEWFLDRDGTLSYLPRPDEDLTTATVIAPVGRTIRAHRRRARGGPLRRAPDDQGPELPARPVRPAAAGPRRRPGRGYAAGRHRGQRRPPRRPRGL